jgi:hypothetical protein
MNAANAMSRFRQKEQEGFIATDSYRLAMGRRDDLDR